MDKQAEAAMAITAEIRQKVITCREAIQELPNFPDDPFAYWQAVELQLSLLASDVLAHTAAMLGEAQADASQDPGAGFRIEAGRGGNAVGGPGQTAVGGKGGSVTVDPGT